jgi:hypothetical protein
MAQHAVQRRPVRTSNVKLLIAIVAALVSGSALRAFVWEGQDT